MIKRYYKEIIILLGLAVVVVILVCGMPASLNLGLLSHDLDISSELNDYIPAISEAVMNSLNTFIKRLIY